MTWREGKTNPADYLSRHAITLRLLPKKWQEECGELEKTVWFLQFSPYTEAISLEKIIKRTETDTVLKKLTKSIQKGYIDKKDEDMKPFSKIQDEISISDSGQILKKDRIILPASLIAIAIKKAHQGCHPGLTKMKRRLRTHFWFPPDGHEDQLLGCQLFTTKTTKEPITTPGETWKEVNIDLFGPTPSKNHILVVQDNCSFQLLRVSAQQQLNPAYRH